VAQVIVSIDLTLVSCARPRKQLHMHRDEFQNLVFTDGDGQMNLRLVTNSFRHSHSMNIKIRNVICAQEGLASGNNSPANDTPSERLCNPSLKTTSESKCRAKPSSAIEYKTINAPMTAITTSLGCWCLHYRARPEQSNIQVRGITRAMHEGKYHDEHFAKGSSGCNIQAT
jgi:hypothetical protein